MATVLIEASLPPGQAIDPTNDALIRRLHRLAYEHARGLTTPSEHMHRVLIIVNEWENEVREP